VQSEHGRRCWKGGWKAKNFTRSVSRAVHPSRHTNWPRLALTLAIEASGQMHGWQSCLLVVPVICVSDAAAVPADKPDSKQRGDSEDM